MAAVERSKVLIGVVACVGNKVVNPLKSAIIPNMNHIACMQRVCVACHSQLWPLNVTLSMNSGSNLALIVLHQVNNRVRWIVDHSRH